jgi:hypothetical protein
LFDELYVWIITKKVRRIKAIIIGTVSRK